jgi:acyl carrier protein
MSGPSRTNTVFYRSLVVALPTEAEVVFEIQRIAREELEVPDPIQGADPLATRLELDSLRLTILAVSLEDRFRVRLREEDAEHLVTVTDLAQLVIRRARETYPC